MWVTTSATLPLAHRKCTRRRSRLSRCRRRQPGGRDHPSGSVQVDDEPATAMAQAPPGDRACNRTPEGRSPDEPVLVGRQPGRCAAYGAVRGWLQPALAAEGGRQRTNHAAFFRLVAGSAAVAARRIGDAGAMAQAIGVGRCGGGMNFAGPTTYPQTNSSLGRVSQCRAVAATRRARSGAHPATPLRRSVSGGAIAPACWNASITAC